MPCGILSQRVIGIRHVRPPLGMVRPPPAQRLLGKHQLSAHPRPTRSPCHTSLHHRQSALSACARLPHLNKPTRRCVGPPPQSFFITRAAKENPPNGPRRLARERRPGAGGAASAVGRRGCRRPDGARCGGGREPGVNPGSRCVEGGRKRWQGDRQISLPAAAAACCVLWLGQQGGGPCRLAHGTELGGAGGTMPPRRCRLHEQRRGRRRERRPR